MVGKFARRPPAISRLSECSDNTVLQNQGKMKMVRQQIARQPKIWKRHPSKEICKFWQAGRCRRYPCPYLHSELPNLAKKAILQAFESNADVHVRSKVGTKHSTLSEPIDKSNTLLKLNNDDNVIEAPNTLLKLNNIDNVIEAPSTLLKHNNVDKTTCLRNLITNRRKSDNVNDGNPLVEGGAAEKTSKTSNLIEQVNEVQAQPIDKSPTPLKLSNDDNVIEAPNTLLKLNNIDNVIEAPSTLLKHNNVDKTTYLRNLITNRRKSDNVNDGNPLVEGGAAEKTSKTSNLIEQGNEVQAPKRDDVCNSNNEETSGYMHQWFTGNYFSLLADLEGHDKGIVGIALQSESGKLYTASIDGVVKVWDCNTGQCTKVENMGCEIGCLFSRGPWVFIGVPKAIQAWNTETGMAFNLGGATGQVHALEVGNETLFAGTEDGCILAWKPNTEGSSFELVSMLLGHQQAVLSLIVRGMRLYSGSTDSTIKVWDLMTLECIHTVSDHKSIVKSLMCWDNFLLSCSLDHTVKVWATSDSGLELIYTNSREHGVLALCGMDDNQARPVLLCSYSDKSVHLFDLPSFSERGSIFATEEIRAVQVGPHGLFFTGDTAGELKVWKWLTSEEPSV